MNKIIELAKKYWEFPAMIGFILLGLLIHYIRLHG